MIYLDAGIVMRLVEGAAQVRLPIETRLGTIPGAERILVTSTFEMAIPDFQSLMLPTIRLTHAALSAPSGGTSRAGSYRTRRR